MSKSHQLVDLQQPGSSKLSPTTTDWSKCVLCQEVTSEALQCPANSKRHDIGAGQGYSTLSTSILRFSEIRQLPMPIDLNRLDEGNGMEATFKEHMAKWHKSCHTKFNSTKLRRAEKRRIVPVEDSDANCPVPTKKIRLSRSNEPGTQHSCFFCDGTSEPLREASTFMLDKHVRQAALALQDGKLLAKLSAGDLMAQEAKYHPVCLASLYKKAKSHEEPRHDDTDKIHHSIALAELLAHVEEAKVEEGVAPVLKLADLVKLYTARLEQLGVTQQNRLNSTKLKDRILSHFPDLSAHKEGRDVLLAFTSDVGLALRKACVDYDDEAICLARAATIVRRDMFKLQAIFTGTFDQECQLKSVPHSLLALVSMIHHGPSIKSQGADGFSQATLSVAQMLQYNSFVRQRPETTSAHHNKARETPLPIYIGLTIHAWTRKRDLVDTMFDLGMSISYDRVLEISTSMGNRVCDQYHRDGAVCPPNLRQGLLTLAAVDNFDHNTSSTTATGSFHGTGISAFQHPNEHSSGLDRREHRILVEKATGSKKVSKLPHSYTNVCPVDLPRKDPPIPEVDGPISSDGQAVSKALHEEFRFVFLNTSFS